MCLRTFNRCLGFVIALAVICPVHVGAQAVPESRLEAAIVSKFPQFIEWPPAAVDGRASVDLCVAAPDPFGPDLQALVSGVSIANRPLQVRVVSSAADVPTCHVLFLPSRRDTPHPLLAVAASRPILTVSDDPRFLDQGGIVALRVVDGRVRFEIDASRARGVGLRISSQLLRLAVNVRGGPS